MITRPNVIQTTNLWLHNLCLEVLTGIVMSCAWFRPMHSLYFHYLCNVPDVATVGTIFNVFSMTQCVPDSNPTASRRAIIYDATIGWTLNQKVTSEDFFLSQNWSRITLMRIKIITHNKVTWCLVVYYRVRHISSDFL